MKEALDKAFRYLERVGEPTTVVIADLDSEENIVLYSNEQLDGCRPVDGIYSRKVPADSLTGDQSKALHLYLTRGAKCWAIGSSDGKSNIYIDLDTNVFGLPELDEKTIRHYAFLPTADITRFFFNEKDLKYYGGVIEILETLPMDALIVHEVLHGEIGSEARAELTRELERKGHDIPDYSMVDELYSKLGDMFYLMENYPELVPVRKKVFEEEIEKTRERFLDMMKAINKVMEDNPDAKPFFGTPPHGAASHLYFEIEKDPELWAFVQGLFEFESGTGGN